MDRDTALRVQALLFRRRGRMVNVQLIPFGSGLRYRLAAATKATFDPLFRMTDREAVWLTPPAGPAITLPPTSQLDLGPSQLRQQGLSASTSLRASDPVKALELKLAGLSERLRLLQDQPFASTPWLECLEAFRPQHHALQDSARAPEGPVASASGSRTLRLIRGEREGDGS